MKFGAARVGLTPLAVARATALCCLVLGCAAPPQVPVPLAKQAAATPSVPTGMPQAPKESDEPVALVEFANPSAFPRASNPLWLSFYDLGWPEGSPRSERLRLHDGERAHALEVVDQDGDGSHDAVLALVDLAANETKTLTLTVGGGPVVPRSKRTQAEISHKVGGHWQPRTTDPTRFEYVGGTFQNVTSLVPPKEHSDHSFFIRYEGPGIESDLVAYRIYLDQRNGFDIFGKKAHSPVLQGIGLDGFETYHQMSDWGMDILKVGKSLGTGGFGFWNESKREIDATARVDGWNASVTRNGDFDASFRIDYQNWRFGKKSADVRADFSMTGGSRLVHTELSLSEALDGLSIGLVLHEGVEVLKGTREGPGTAYTYLGTWGRQSLNGDDLGMAVLLPNARVAREVRDRANVAVITNPAKELDYYFLAAWQGEPEGIRSRDAFVTYLEQEAEKLTIANRVRLSTAAAAAAVSNELSAEGALDWSVRLADSELARKTLAYRHGGWDAHRKRKPTFEYDVVGLLPLAYDELHRERPDPRYAEVMEKVTGSYVTDHGKILEYEPAEFNIDAINPGRNLLRLLEKTGEQRYETAARTLRRQLERQPRTREGAFWHKKKYPSQLWLDGVYMAMPFLAQYSARFEQGKSFDDVVREFELTRTHLRDAKTGLYFHGWDESKRQTWADPESGRSREFWGRGMGWLAMALVDVLDVLPEQDEARRGPLLEMTRELASALVAHQDATGTWWQIVDQPEAPGNYRESTASAMFTYFFAKATRKGYLDASYREVAEKAYEGLLGEFVLVHPDGRISMTNQCLVGGLGFGRDGSYRYYVSEPIVRNDPKGTGPFILAGVEVARLLRHSAGERSEPDQ